MSLFFPSRMLAAPSAAWVSMHAEILLRGTQLVVQANAVIAPVRANAMDG
jgi:hypothetical protein